MRWNIRHIKQDYPVSCGNCAYGMIVGITEKQAIKELGNTDGGVNCYTVQNALNNRKIPNLKVNYHIPFSAALTYLKLLSFQYPLWVASEYRSGGIKEKRGRDYVRFHACTIWQGKVFDPGESDVFPIDCYNHTFNKSLEVKEIIICGIEK